MLLTDTKITVPCLRKLIQMHENTDEFETMITPTQIAAQFADWTDPRKLFRDAQKQREEVDCSVHVELAIAALERIDDGSTRESSLRFG